MRADVKFLVKWIKLDNPSRESWNQWKEGFREEHGFSFDRKPRYFIDENLGKGATEIMKHWGANVTDVWEQNLIGHPDENIWKYVRKEKRIILTHDDDFMEHGRFPLKECHGLFILPHKEGGETPLYEKLSHLYGFMSVGAGIAWQKKIIIRENEHWEIISLSENGSVENNLYDLSGRHHTYELSRET